MFAVTSFASVIAYYVILYVDAVVVVVVGVAVLRFLFSLSIDSVMF